MNYALSPSPVYALAAWLGFSHLLFMGLLSLSCLALSAPALPMPHSALGAFPPCCSPAMGYCHLPERQGGLPRSLARIPGNTVRPLKSLTAGTDWASSQLWNVHASARMEASELGAGPRGSARWHLQGLSGHRLSPEPWGNHKATAVLLRWSWYMEQGCHAAGRLSLKHRSFQGVCLDTQEDFSPPRG